MWACVLKWTQKYIWYKNTEWYELYTWKDMK